MGKAMNTKQILDEIEQLEKYTAEQVQNWKAIRQRQNNSKEQDMVATAVWSAYRDMAIRIADLGELAEKITNMKESGKNHEAEI